MKYVDLDSLERRLQDIRKDFQSRTPFRYTVIESFFEPSKAELIASVYPAVHSGTWDGTTYIDQVKKFQRTTFESNTVMSNVFLELNSNKFLKWLEEVTEIKELIADPALFGGGLHQSVNGAFLNVHVDFNLHPKTNDHRRLNVLIYLNSDWKEEFGGVLELWDLRDKKRKMQLANIAPAFNRCVIFETNEISFHGHPKPLNIPAGSSRKSIATYYYTAACAAIGLPEPHNTIYVNTEGVSGVLRKFYSISKTTLERLGKRFKKL